MAAQNENGRLRNLIDALRSSLWPIPSVALVLAIGLAVGLPTLDDAVDEALPDFMTGYLFNGGPQASRAVLQTIAGSLITVTALTFSLTILTLQLASSQFSPRLLRTFARDGFVHLTLGLFVATFMYALTVLRTVRTADSGQEAFVPRLSVTFGFLLTITSVVALVLFLAHLAREIRVEYMLQDVRSDTEGRIRRLLPERDRDEGGGNGGGQTALSPPAGAVPLCAHRSGFLESVNRDALLEAAVAADAVLFVERSPGDFLVADTPIAFAWPVTPSASIDIAKLSGALDEAVTTDTERTAVQDVSFGLRQLTDVATKALSPGINDPTTAVHAIGHASALLCEMARRDLRPSVGTDDEGRTRVVTRRADMNEMLELTVGPVRRYAASDPDVLARLLMLLREVAWAVDLHAHKHDVAEQLVRMRATVEDQDFDPAEQGRLRALASRVDDALQGRWLANEPRDE